MKATWHRAAGAIFDRFDNEPGTISAYWNYDLGSWSFGVRLERDEMWFDLHFDFGPIEISVLYWRHYVVNLSATPQ